MVLQLAAVYKEAEAKISTEPALLLVAAISHADAVAAEPHAQPLLSLLLDQCSAKVCAVLRRVEYLPVTGIAHIDTNKRGPLHCLISFRFSYGFCCNRAGSIVVANPT